MSALDSWDTPPAPTPTPPLFNWLTINISFVSIHRLTFACRQSDPGGRLLSVRAGEYSARIR